MKTEEELRLNEKALERLKTMIDRTVVLLRKHEELIEEEGESSEDISDLKDAFYGFREYWIHFLKF
jgi:hypothetical protein